MKRKLKMGMVGGGRGAFIGGVHRRAANLDGNIELVAGAFSSDPKKVNFLGKIFIWILPEFTIPIRKWLRKKKLYRKIKSILLPLWFKIIYTLMLQNLSAIWFNVICDKPVTYDLAQARELRKIINKTKKSFCLNS